MAEIFSLHPALAVHNIKNILPLTLDLQLTQYVKWAELFMVVLRAHSVIDHILSESDVSADNWKQLDAIVLSWIYGTISEDLLLSIIEPGLKAWEAWLRLNDLFRINKTARAEDLRIQIDNTHLEDYPNVTAYSEQVKSLADELKDIDEMTNRFNQETDMDETDYVLGPIGRQMYIAAIQDDWDSVSHIFNEDAKKFRAEILNSGQTALAIAVGTNRSHSFVENAVEQIMICGGGVETLRTLNNSNKETVLHVASRLGNARAAKLLVSKDPDMSQFVTDEGETAVFLAASNSDVEILHYLLSVTRDEVGEDGLSPFRGRQGADLLGVSICSGYYDVALYLIENYSYLVQEKNRMGRTALQCLAAKPNAFPSGNQLGWFQNIIYSAISVIDEPLKYLGLLEGSTATTKAGPTNNLLLRCSLAVPYVKKIRDLKVRHMQTKELVKQMCDQLYRAEDPKLISHIIGPTIGTATTYGCHELVEQCIRGHPEMIWYNLDGQTLFTLAIQYRQEKVFNLIYQMSAHRLRALAPETVDGIALRIVIHLPPYHSLTRITGAALQMQRELLWFKEVENLSENISKEFIGDGHWTPQSAFSEEHKQLLKDAQEWMKNTASSSSVVAALIITMTFAALFGVPGGNNDEGKSLYLQDKTFLIFVISDAIALFSSVASVLMFLSTLTHSSLDDFLYALPLRLTLGLLSLFISLAATMAAFSATLVIVLRDEVQWIVIPVAFLACFPAVLFLWLQYPLLHELVQATFGKSIFYKQNDFLIH